MLLKPRDWVKPQVDGREARRAVGLLIEAVYASAKADGELITLFNPYRFYLCA